MSIVDFDNLTDNEPDHIPVVPSAPMANGDSIPTAFDPRQLRAGRLARLRATMAEQGYAAMVLFDPNNQRYATGSRNMFGYFLRNSTRYIYVPLEGPVILFEYPGSAHVSTWLETIDESRTSKVVWSAVNQRDNLSSDPFGVEIAELIEEHGRGNRKIGLDRCALNLARSLEARNAAPIHPAPTLQPRPEPWSDSLTANPGQRLTVPDNLTALTALSLTV